MQLPGRADPTDLRDAASAHRAHREGVPSCPGWDSGRLVSPAVAKGDACHKGEKMLICGTGEEREASGRPPSLGRQEAPLGAALGRAYGALCCAEFRTRGARLPARPGTKTPIRRWALWAPAGIAQGGTLIPPARTPNWPG